MQNFLPGYIKYYKILVLVRLRYITIFLSSFNGVLYLLHTYNSIIFALSIEFVFNNLTCRIDVLDFQSMTILSFSCRSLIG